MTTSRDPDRLVRAFLAEGEDSLNDQVYDAVRAVIERTPQRAGVGPWRMPIMNKIVGLGLAAAAVIAAVLIGSQLFGSPGGGVGADPTVAATPQPTPEPTPEPTPSPAAWRGLPAGAHVVTGADDPVQVAVDVTSPGWRAMPEFDAVDRDDDGLDPPVTVGGSLLAWGWPAGTGINVYGDACQWSTTLPGAPATTPEEIAEALAAQEGTDATAPVDVTLGGFEGKAITLEVPMSYDLPNATREEKFADCDSSILGFYGVDGDTEPARNALGAGQIDELWIMDVDGSIVILDAAYSPATPAEVVDELRAMVESATFEAP